MLILISRGTGSNVHGSYEKTVPLFQFHLKFDQTSSRKLKSSDEVYGSKAWQLDNPIARQFQQKDKSVAHSLTYIDLKGNDASLWQVWHNKNSLVTIVDYFKRIQILIISDEHIQAILLDEVPLKIKGIITAIPIRNTHLPTSYAATLCQCQDLVIILSRATKGKVIPTHKTNKVNKEGNQSKTKNSINLYLTLFPQDNQNPRGNTA